MTIFMGIGSALMVIVQYILICEALPSLASRLIKNRVSDHVQKHIRTGMEIITTLVFAVYSSYRYDLRFMPANHGILWSLICSVLLALALFAVIHFIVDPVLEKMFVKSHARYKDAVGHLKEQGFRLFIKACVLAPIIEEVIVRGVIQGEILRGEMPMVSIGVASLIFGMLHFNVLQILSALVPSLVLGVVYWLTDSLLMCMAIHMMFNGMSLVAMRDEGKEVKDRSTKQLI